MDMHEVTKRQFHEAFGARLEQLRTEQGMSKNKLGITVGAAGTMIAQWENGGSPSIFYVCRLAEALGVSITYLVTGKTSETTNPPDTGKAEG